MHILTNPARLDYKRPTPFLLFDSKRILHLLRFFDRFNMESFNGLDSDEEYEIDCQLLAGREVEIQFVLPESETCDAPKQRGSKQRREGRYGGVVQLPHQR